MSSSEVIRVGNGRGRLGLLLLAGVLLLLGAVPAHADQVDCSSFVNGVLDGNVTPIPPDQINIDTNCTIRNYPGGMSTNFSFKTQPGQTDERWLIIFDNVVHTGQMSCNAVAGHHIWFVNGSSSGIHANCQNLFIPVEKIDKKNPVGQTTAAIGVPFTYTLTIPVLFDPLSGTVVDFSGSENDLHGITVTDDLNATGVDLTYVSHTVTWKDTGLPVPHQFSNVGGVLTFEFAPLIVPAFEQFVISLTVVLDDSPVNTVGTQFVNTAKWDFGRLIDGVFYEPLPGEWGISPPLTIAAPRLVMTKTGPATLGRTLNLGEWGQFALDVQNTGAGDAWNVTIRDRLPDGATGGMCDAPPEVQSVTLAGSPLTQGTHYTLSWSGAPTCELTLTLLDAAGAIGPTEHLIINYRARLDADTQDAITLTNVAGATEWFNGDSSVTDRVTFTRTLTDGTPGTIDHEDAHTVTVALHGYFFEKSVQDLTSGVNPAATAAPGDTLRYTLRLQATDVPLTDIRFTDDLGAMNPTAVFVPGSLTLVPGTIPPGADTSNTNPSGGTNGAGILDIRNLNLAANTQVTISFDITLAASLADGTIVTNQADLISAGIKVADSDDPNVNGQADPNVVGDEDPTRVLIEAVPAPVLIKANTQATATVGVPFAYRITVPSTPHTAPLYDVRIVDDLTASAADLQFVSVTKISGSGTWTPVNTGTATQLVLEDPVNGIDIPAGEQAVLEITVVLTNSATNIAGLQFTNTADYTYDLINGNDVSQRPGGPGTTAPMTIVEPDLTLEKSGPVRMILGVPETFTLDVHNTTTTPAWNLTITDLLPNAANGGTCDAAPTAVTARVFQADGTTPVSGPLAAGTDFSATWNGSPSCTVSFTMISAAAVVGPDQRLIVTYQTVLDAGSQDGVTLTNIAGATQWFSADASSSQRRTFTRTITDGTVGTLDFQDAHTIIVGLPNYLFEKTVTNVTTGQSPATQASPGDRLRYQLRIENLGVASLDNLSIVDDLDRLNTPAAFAPGTLQIVTVPPGADASNSSATGGTKGTGLIDVRNISVAPGASVTVEFEIVLAAVIANGTAVTNQSLLSIGGAPLAPSDDPNVNGPADPFVPNDEDPTVVPIGSAAIFRVQKISTDLTGDPNVLRPGDTLQYTITVKNIGNADASDAFLRDAVPANTHYVANSTTLNGNAVPDGAGGSSPLATGIAIYAPENPTPGAMRADASATTANVATIVFSVTIDAGVVDGTVISNQGFVTAPASGATETPSDDPDTVIPNDPTRDVVGSVPLLFAPKAAALLIDNGSPGIVDPLDTLHYTITIYNTGAVPATGIVLTDGVPANTTYVANSTTVNGAPFGQPDGGVAPLSAGIPIPDIAPGQSAVVGFNLQVNAGVAAGTVISNQATVTTNEAPNLLTDGDGNPATGPEPTIVVVGNGQQLAITKQVAVVGGGPVLAGSTLDYAVIVTNVASVPGQGVVLTDDLPVGLTLVPGSATLNGAATGVTVAGSLITADYSTTYGPLAPGAIAVLRFRAVVGAAVPNGTTITNTGVVTWNTNQTANASVSVQVGFVPGIGVLSGTAWHDADFDDVIDTLPARPLVGWSVELLRNNTVIASVLTDAGGAYQVNGVPPNDTNGDQYLLRFRAPGAGLNTASLGIASSVFTNGPQQISNIIVPSSGANLTGLNLPIDPNGVVYNEVSRAAIAGATVTMLSASGSPLPASCFVDPAQQGQVTLASGFYKFDMNFSDPLACPSGGSYLIAVIEPGASAPAVSALIPPATDQSTPPFDVPSCPGTPGVDAVTATLTYCEAQIQPTAPGPTVPPRSPGTIYYLHFTLDNSGGAGSAELYNNHIPIDPPIDDLVTITKTTPSLNVSRGQLVPYEITVNNTTSDPITDLAILDTFPRGFHYVEGSARIEGERVEPTVDGNQLLFTVEDGLDAQETKTLVLALAVGAGVSEGEFTNRAQAVSAVAPASVGYSGIASATVRVVPDPTFDCTDVIGKVFDDANRNGEQDKSEHGLPNIRLVTARGLAATTDPQGRFHITCAVVPREDRGSNFVLKLDDRTLPTGYRMTTRQVQVQRATRGKVLPFHFGAAIARVIELDIADAVFEPNTTKMREQWKPRLDLLIEELAKGEAILRLSYVADLEDKALVDARLAAIKQAISEKWAAQNREPLNVETEVFWRRGGPPSGGSPAGVLESFLPSVDAGPPMFETTPGSAVERQMPADTPFDTWSQDPERVHEQIGDKLEKREVTSEQAKIVKLKNVVPPIHFESGVANIPPSTIAKLRSVLDSMKDLPNVRLHLVGHADSEGLSPALAGVFGDNQGLSRERAGEVAEFIQTALALPPEAISFDWAGDTQPIASNATDAGRAQNRRVEVEVWYDQMEEKSSLEDVVVHEDIKRVKVCRTETVCKLSYQEGHARRARVKNLIPPLHAGEENVQVSEEFVRQIEQALHDLRDKQHVTVKFIGYTDDAPLAGRAERIYGTHLALSKALGHRAALAVKDALKLSTAAIASDGRGASRPIASNQTDRGRALNRRVEVEFWYDDPLADLPQEPQICPDGAGADLVTVVYDPPWGPIEPLQLDAHGEAQVPAGYGDALRRGLADVADRTHPRLRFIGYTRNEGLERRTAMVYGDDVGLSTARARRAMEKIKADLKLTDAQAEHEGRGFVQSDDVVNAGFVQGDTSYVVVQVVYDDLAQRDDYDGVDVTPLTRELEAKEPLALNLMRISVDGKPIDDPGRSLADIQRCTDVALDDAQIQFRFDNLKAVPRLSVTAAPIAAPVDGGDAATVQFKAYTNYPHWIARSEVRIFEHGQSVQAEPLGVVAVDERGDASWQPPADWFASPIRELTYVLRAYDEQGQFDETEPQPLWLKYAASSPDLDLPQAGGGDPLLANYGETGPSTRNIPLGNVGSVQVHGSGVPANHSVFVAGSPVPVDANGNFVGEVVLPQGAHTVEVAVLDEQGNGELFLRDLELKKSDWFYVGIADVTVQADLQGQPVRGALKGQDAPYDPNSNVDGRLAFFTTGKFWDTWKLTASADTREEPIEDLFKDFVKKNPETLFRRIDPDYYYPTFGDDGTVTEQAPTNGKFFVKVDQRENHAMWGNFKIGYLENELVQVDRGLYGGNVHYQTLSTTKYGEQRLALDAFGAEPGTVPSREEFRGTDGSLYFLRRQDILVGSERLRVEVRDKDSQLVTGVVQLRPTVDYDIDYLQGRILLTEPLSSTVADNLLVHSDGFSGDELWLVAQYEFTPGFEDIDSLSAGGTGSVWVTDWLKFGATGNRNNNDNTEDSSLYGGDVTARLSTDTWAKVQMGRSEGLVTDSFRSDDGGFLFANIGSAAVLSEADANAYRADVNVGVADFIKGGRGRLALYGQSLEEGYAGPGMTALTDTDQYGGVLGVPITKRLQFTAKGDRRVQDDRLTTHAAEADLAYQLGDAWTLGAGVRNDDRKDDSPIVPLTQDEGERTDAAVKLGFDPKGRWRAYTFGQGTVARSGDRDANNRGGVGGSYRLNDRMVFDGEVSGGNLGPAVKLGTRYQQTKDTQHYLSYAFDNEEREYGAMHQRRGTLISGIKSRMSDSASVYLEDRYQHGDASGLSRAMGLNFAPSDRWTLGANWGFGTLIDHDTHAETDRNAGGVRLSYGFDELHLSGGVEYRKDEVEQLDLSTNDRETWLFRVNSKYQVTPSGRVLAKFNHSFSNSSLGDFYNGEYTEGVLGYAYRPVQFDRLHTLVKYTYFYNMPTTDQVTLQNVPAQFIQKSHIASVDATYDINKFFSIGGKYGYRRSEVSLDRDDPDFFDNNAHLYIVRGDYRFLKNWEGTVEGRMLDLTDLDERKIGSLFTIYRYLGDNVKVGVGYNFTDFSDDLTDLSYDHQGVFFNLVGSM